MAMGIKSEPKLKQISIRGNNGKLYLPVPLPKGYLNGVYDAVYAVVSGICGEGRVVSEETDGTITYELAVEVEAVMNRVFCVQYQYHREAGIVAITINGAFEV